MQTRTRVSKWWRRDRPGSKRCPVIHMSRVGPHQCEMTAEYPHSHPVEVVEVRSSDVYEVEPEVACSTCGSTETTELSDERQSITICATCGSDQ